jgi:hypothetical protein
MRRLGVAFALATWSVTGDAQAQIDFSGEWRPLIHEDLGHRVDERAIAGPGAGTGAGGPRVGDYAGLPINDAARSKAESWDPRIWAAPEHQTIPHPGAYWVHAPGGLRVSRVVDDASGRVVGFRLYRVGGPGSTTRTIWTDGRPHPPDYAAHTWQGFSTGRWNGETLIVETSHLKAGWVRRNGVPASDRTTLTQHMVRHGEYLTIVNIVSDPVYLDEPYVTSGTWVLDPRLQIVEPPRSQIVEEIHGLRRAFVPHFLPGMNIQLKEFAARTGLPFEATRGGQDTMYPEYQRRLKVSTAVRSKPDEP